MNSKAAQYLNEIVSLTILAAMVGALIAGQAGAESRELAAETGDRYEPRRAALTLVVDPELVEVMPPIVEAIVGKSADKAAPRPRPLGK